MKNFSNEFWTLLIQSKWITTYLLALFILRRWGKFISNANKQLLTVMYLPGPVCSWWGAVGDRRGKVHHDPWKPQCDPSPHGWEELSAWQWGIQALLRSRPQVFVSLVRRCQLSLVLQVLLCCVKILLITTSAPSPHTHSVVMHALIVFLS